MAQRLDAVEWFETLYEQHHRRAFGLAYSFLGESHAAEDVLQEAFLSAWRSGQRPDPRLDATRGWLLAIVRNRSIDVLRARRRRPTVPIEETAERAGPVDVPAEVERTADQLQARRVLDHLPHEQRQVLELAYFEGLTHTEIATRLELPLGTVKGRIRLALHRLRAHLFSRQDPSISA